MRSKLMKSFPDESKFLNSNNRRNNSRDVFPSTDHIRQKGPLILNLFSLLVLFLWLLFTIFFIIIASVATLGDYWTVKRRKNSSVTWHSFLFMKPMYFIYKIEDTFSFEKLFIYLNCDLCDIVFNGTETFYINYRNCTQFK